jgi:hypothetical protein
MMTSFAADAMPFMPNVNTLTKAFTKIERTQQMPAQQHAKDMRLSFGRCAANRNTPRKKTSGESFMGSVIMGGFFHAFMPGLAALTFHGLDILDGVSAYDGVRAERRTTAHENKVDALRARAHGEFAPHAPLFSAQNRRRSLLNFMLG